MTTSYEELTPESREQVDAFLENMEWHLAEISELDNMYMKEHVSNLVQTCIYLTKKKDNKAVILTNREWKSLSRAFINLYKLLTDGPGYLGDYFPDSPGEYREVQKWAERLDP